MLNARRPQVQVSFELVFVEVSGDDFLSLPPLACFTLYPSFSLSSPSRSVFTTATTPLFAPWCIVSGFVRACSGPRNIHDTCRLSCHLLAPFSPRERSPVAEALKIGSNVLDVAFPVRARPDSRCFYLELYLRPGLHPPHFVSICPRGLLREPGSRAASSDRLDRYTGSITMYTVREHASRSTRPRVPAPRSVIRGPER